jgi:hypothetical protein
LTNLEQKTFHKCQGNIEDVEELQIHKKNGDPANEKYEKIRNSLTWFAVKKKNPWSEFLAPIQNSWADSASL